MIMMRHRLAWLVALPVFAAGSFAAHQVGACATLSERCGDELAQPGQLARLAPLLALLVAMLTVGLIAEGLAAASHARRTAAAWPFAIGVPVSFLLQEHAEALLQPGASPVALLLDPAVLAGVLLQVPFAALAWRVSAALLRAAPRLVRALASGTGRVAWRPGWTPLGATPDPGPWSPAVLATCAAGRAPPAPARHGRSAFALS